MSNIETAKLFFGVVLDKLQCSFPAAVYLSAEDLWPEFEVLADGGSISVKNGKRSHSLISVEDASTNKNTKRHYSELMLRWMAVEGYIHSDPTSGFPYDYVLSTKSLAVLNLSLEDDGTTLGTALGRATGRLGDKVQSDLVSKAIDRIFEAFQGF